MAARFVVVLALVALGHSSPVLINGVEIRDGRSLSTANGYASGFGGKNQASAHVMNNVAQSNSVSTGSELARDGLFYGQGQAMANAQHFNDNAAVEPARLHGYYQPYAQPIPVAQPAYIAYNQLPAEELIYPGAPATAMSSAIINEFAEKSNSEVKSHGAGKADAHSQTSGSHGITNTNAMTDSGYNSASSNANSNSGFASTKSVASSGLGNDIATSNAETNGNAFAFIPSEHETQPAVIDVKNSGFYNPGLYNPALYNSAQYNSAASTANVKGHGIAQSSAKTAPAPARRSISWRFGTAYDIPAGYGSIKAATPVTYQTPVAYQTPVVYQPAPIVYEAAPAFGNAKSNVQTHGLGNAGASSIITPYNRHTQSTANSAANGNALSNSEINANSYRSGMFGSGLKSSTSTIGQGAAIADANNNNGNGIASVAGQSQGGFINAKSGVINNDYGYYRSGQGAPWSSNNANIAINGSGAAKAFGYSTNNNEKRAESIASSNGGAAMANSFSH